jgi:hypothetical protein
MISHQSFGSLQTNSNISINIITNVIEPSTKHTQATHLYFTWSARRHIIQRTVLSIIRTKYNIKTSSMIKLLIINKYEILTRTEA